MKTLTGLVTAIAFALALAACSQSDAGITTSIKTKFAQDDLVKAHEINVTTTERVVTLTGNVDTAAARQQALRLARETEGVLDVVDQLQVEATATTGDGDVDIDVEVDEDLERGARATGRAIREGAEETGEALRETGEAVRDAVTDEDRDSDKDGK